MNSYERIQAVLNFRPFDRLPVVEWAPWWDKTLNRWHTEGLPASVKSLREVSEHFGLGIVIRCDHQTPPGVSYQDCQLYLRLFREYAQRAGQVSRERAVA